MPTSDNFSTRAVRNFRLNDNYSRSRSNPSSRADQGILSSASSRTASRWARDNFSTRAVHNFRLDNYSSRSQQNPSSRADQGIPSSASSRTASHWARDNFSTRAVHNFPLGGYSSRSQPILSSHSDQSMPSSSSSHIASHQGNDRRHRSVINMSTSDNFSTRAVLNFPINHNYSRSQPVHRRMPRSASSRTANHPAVDRRYQPVTSMPTSDNSSTRAVLNFPINHNRSRSQPNLASQADQRMPHFASSRTTNHRANNRRYWPIIRLCFSLC